MIRALYIKTRIEEYLNAIFLNPITLMELILLTQKYSKEYDDLVNIPNHQLKLENDPESEIDFMERKRGF